MGLTSWRTWHGDLCATVRSNGGRHLVEGVCVLVVLALIAVRLAGYGVTDDPDPDGYVTYADHLKRTWTLLDFARLPGYPFFLAIVDAAGPSTMHLDVYWAQIGIFLIWSAAIWVWARRLMGPAVALTLLAILATPCLYTRFATIMLADLLASITFGIAALVLIVTLTAARPGIDLRRQIGLAVIFSTAFLVHPSTRLMLALLILGLGIAVVLCRGRFGLPDNQRMDVRTGLVRLGVALVVLVLSTGATASWADRGNSQYNAAALVVWLVTCLPPAADTEDDRKIEAMKAAASARLGEPVAQVPPIYHPEFLDLYAGKVPGNPVFGERYRRLADLDGGPFPEERLGPLWRGRLAARPFALLACGARHTWWRHHIVVKQFTPFASEERFATLGYLPSTGSPRSVLFRTYGIELATLPDDASANTVRSALIWELGRIAFVVGTTVTGGVVLVRRYGATVLAMALALAAWIAFLGLVAVVEPRYLLGFAPAIYLAQATGIVTILRRVVQLGAPIVARRSLPT